MRKIIWISIVIFVIALLAAAGARLIYYYGGFYAEGIYGFDSYTPPERPLHEVTLQEAEGADWLDAADNPSVSKGVVVVDYGHNNALFIEELNVLLSKVVSRGYSYELVMGAESEEDSNGGSSSSSSNSEQQVLADKLRYADALILPLPRSEYSPQEIREIEQFVEKGGRVLIIGDPTRTIGVEALNSIAGSFGLIYANDYLYSLENNDNNYRNVIYSDFKESPLTEGLGEESKVVFYAGGSIVAPGHEIILGDETTHSSISQAGRTMAAAALTTNNQVLALGDLTFFGEPYSAAEGNETFINNVASFLTGGEREYELQDFPYFFNDDISVVFQEPQIFNSQFEDSVKLKDFLESSERTVTFADSLADTGSNDVIFVGRFDDVEAIQPYLARAGVTLVDTSETDDTEALTGTLQANSGRVMAVSDTPPEEEEGQYVKGRIQIAGVGDLELGGSTIFYLDREQGRNTLVILSENSDTNADAFDTLLDNDLDRCRVNSNIAVCQTQEPGETETPSLRSIRINKILVVSADTGRARADEKTSLLEYNEVLSGTYNLDSWIISEDGSPDVDQLLEYDAVIWTTGDYWDDSIAEEDAALLSKYAELGGNLILSGASIAFDWDHTDFLNDVIRADYEGVAEQRDLEVALPEHPIADGFEEQVFSLADPPSGETLEIDVVDNTSDARVIFQRGPGSDEEGAASVIAYEDDRVKIAYFAFPMYLVPLEQRDLLINNSIDWFTRKPLDLPEEEAEADQDQEEETTDEEGETDTGQEENGEGEDNTENGEGGEDTGNGDDGGEDETGGEEEENTDSGNGG